MPRNLASVTVNANSATNCVVNALVEATPISAPARVKKVRVDARGMALSGTLQIDRVRVCPCALAYLSASIVSSVSPDCEMVTIKLFGFTCTLR